ncbi:Uncharacterised protein [Candidatus Venteria ishoeyi]|uniref:Uncharacterized protein n=1 Tax=Candidatus Venteria ishoeyi TaxID=1899563 RepID=A0A1H6FDE2_9GAMM|nr:Uncharacterised protein [Candidatus Venteria ishoeyi]
MFLIDLKHGCLQIFTRQASGAAPVRSLQAMLKYFGIHNLQQKSKYNEIKNTYYSRTHRASWQQPC